MAGFPKVRSREPGALWLCLYLPQLPLEVLTHKLRPESAQAISAEAGRRTLVVTANACATARGVRVGMPVNTALALVPDLGLHTRSAALESAALARLADWAGRFTPAVSRSDGNALLLEIQGSLRLFGGLEALQVTLLRELSALGHAVRMACTPTARASLWLAQAGVACTLRTASELRQTLARIPVRHLGWPTPVLQTLLQMGLTTLGDCVRLPREGFARRLGRERLRELDQAFGRHPELHQYHAPPTRFIDALELPAETTDAALLLEGFQQLFLHLGRELESRQASVRGVCCRLQHPDGQETRVRLGLRQAAGAGLLPGLLRLRLEAVVLPAAVVALALRADLVPGQVPVGTDLLGQPLHPDGDLSGLLERLRARLGSQAVHGCALIAEHRPESAWRAVVDPLAAVPATEILTATQPRPVWLLPMPQLLGLMTGQPAWHGVLALERGPERIESGWWDGGDVRRDYYQASNPRGATLWIYRDLRSEAWYLHGIFG